MCLLAGKKSGECTPGCCTSQKVTPVFSQHQQISFFLALLQSETSIFLLQCCAFLKWCSRALFPYPSFCLQRFSKGDAILRAFHFHLIIQPKEAEVNLISFLFHFLFSRKKNPYNHRLLPATPVKTLLRGKNIATGS